MSGRRARHTQNFLHRSAFLSRLLDRCELSRRDLVVEIGAGRGHLTAELAQRCGRVITYDIDARLYRGLERRLAGYGNVTIIHGDFLTCRLPRVGYKVVANLPFNITADAIRKITTADFQLVDAHVIVQKEAALRFAGGPLGIECLASVIVKPWWKIEIVESVSREAFSPIPEVDVVLLRLRRRAEPLVPERNARVYRDFLTYAFTGQGPTLWRNLRAIFSRVQFTRQATDLGFDQRATPAMLTFDQWAGLFGCFMDRVSAEKQLAVGGSENRNLRRQQRLAKDHRTRAVGRHGRPVRR